MPAKLRLFRAIFRGRDDVYAKRWENPRKSGYVFACANEWKVGICRKNEVPRPKKPCERCAHRQYLPLTDAVLSQHLAGKDAQAKPFVAGVYPLLPNETCWFLAIDFDEATWEEDMLACFQTCRGLGLAPALERSRSGDGGHLWLFFEEALSAALARRLGSHIITETLEHHPDIGFKSYDRLFPSQDTMPVGELGNLIALPLQMEARLNDNSVFVDEHLVRWPDQWVFLSQHAKLPRAQVEQIVTEAERRGRILGVRMPSTGEDDPEPWNAPPSGRRKDAPIAGVLPREMQLILGNQVYIAKQGMPPGLRIRLLQLAAFQNAEFYRAQAAHRYIRDAPRIIACGRDTPQYIELPRGCLEDVQKLLKQLGISTTLQDERAQGRALEVSFNGELRPEQLRAAQALLAHDTGVLAAATAFGKTVIAAWLIAQRGVNTLVLVHTRVLLDQWVERLAAFSGLSPQDIGRGKKKATGRLDVAIIQSLIRGNVVDDRVADYGQVIVDECHRVAADTFEQVARQAKARFVVGLSATVTRQDCRHPIIFMQCGPVRYRVDPRAQAAARPFTHNVHILPTSFRSARVQENNPRQEIQSLYSQLISDEARTQRICDDVVKAAQAGRSPLVLTERKDHLDRLEQGLAGRVGHLIVIRSGMGKKKLKAMHERLAGIARDEERVVLAIGKHVGEGFDDPRLDTLFLTFPVSGQNTVVQYAGRLHRLYEGKREARIYDYADLRVGMLASMLNRRCKAYRSTGYTLMLPAGAVPGWPQDVMLPDQPQWRRNYAAGIQRLIRDGVGSPFGDLFASTAAPAGPDSAQPPQRQAAAFLYHRLQSLKETQGRFRLHEPLPIAFDGAPVLEADLVCPDARVAIELDERLNLPNTEVYCRDRRADLALQESGYLVLRFLTQEVAQDLEGVLERIQRALTRTRAHRAHG